MHNELKSAPQHSQNSTQLELFTTRFLSNARNMNSFGTYVTFGTLSVSN
jgi:hypothetical protein